MKLTTREGMEFELFQTHDQQNSLLPLNRVCILVEQDGRHGGVADITKAEAAALGAALTALADGLK